jgi:polyisoprenoid-binding protein YceI
MTPPNGPTGSSIGPLVDAIGTWQLDPSASTIILHTKSMWGLAKVKATFKAAEGSGSLDGNGNLFGRFVIDATSVDTKNRKRDDHLRGSDFFEEDIYPTFIYTATGARLSTGNQVVLMGNLTVHGESRPLDLPVTVTEVGSHTVLVTGEVEIDRSKWGLTWAKMGASLINQVKVAAVFTRV